MAESVSGAQGGGGSAPGGGGAAGLMVVVGGPVCEGQKEQILARIESGRGWGGGGFGGGMVRVPPRPASAGLSV